VIPPRDIIDQLESERPPRETDLTLLSQAERTWGVRILDDHDPSTLPFALRLDGGELSLSSLRRRLRSWEALERISSPVESEEASRIYSEKVLPLIRQTGLDKVGSALRTDHCFVAGDVILPWRTDELSTTPEPRLTERWRSAIQRLRSNERP